MQSRLTLNLRNCWQWPGTWSSCHCLLSAGITGVHTHTWLVVFTVFWPFWKGVLLACCNLYFLCLRDCVCILCYLFSMHMALNANPERACVWSWSTSSSFSQVSAGLSGSPRSPLCETLVSQSPFFSGSSLFVQLLTLCFQSQPSFADSWAPWRTF